MGKPPEEKSSAELLAAILPLTTGRPLRARTAHLPWAGEVMDQIAGLHSVPPKRLGRSLRSYAVLVIAREMASGRHPALAARPDLAAAALIGFAAGLDAHGTERPMPLRSQEAESMVEEYLRKYGPLGAVPAACRAWAARRAYLVAARRAA